MKYSDCCGGGIDDTIETTNCPICSKPCSYIPDSKSNKELSAEPIIMYYEKYLMAQDVPIDLMGAAESPGPEPDEHPELNVSEG